MRGSHGENGVGAAGIEPRERAGCGRTGGAGRADCDRAVGASTEAAAAAAGISGPPPLALPRLQLQAGAGMASGRPGDRAVAALLVGARLSVADCVRRSGDAMRVVSCVAAIALVCAASLPAAAASAIPGSVEPRP